MTVQHTTKLTCEMCDRAVTWPEHVSMAIVRKAAKEMFGWRKDKLGRDVCGAHPKLKGARRTSPS